MKEKSKKISNYCACFIDLLGQRDLYKGEGLVPIFKNETERKAFSEKYHKTVGVIITLQRDAEKFVNSLYKTQKLIGSIPKNQRALFNEMRYCKPKQQRWSDGLLYFISLNPSENKHPIIAIFVVLSLSGFLSYFGLARGFPIRGSVDISWGIELHEKELYGAIIANAYELESEIAQYPRIIISLRTINYLKNFLQEKNTDIVAQNNRRLSKMCLEMIEKDTDGNYFLNYLGEGFQKHIPKEQNVFLYQSALKYINEQLLKHQNECNTKLAFRYSLLRDYFLKYKQ